MSLTSVTSGHWWCATCQAGGEGTDYDKSAEKHTKTTQHGTYTALHPREAKP